MISCLLQRISLPIFPSAASNAALSQSQIYFFGTLDNIDSILLLVKSISIKNPLFENFHDFFKELFAISRKSRIHRIFD